MCGSVPGDAAAAGGPAPSATGCAPGALRGSVRSYPNPQLGHSKSRPRLPMDTPLLGRAPAGPSVKHKVPALVPAVQTMPSISIISRRLMERLWAEAKRTLRPTGPAPASQPPARAAAGLAPGAARVRRRDLRRPVMAAGRRAAAEGAVSRMDMGDRDFVAALRRNNLAAPCGFEGRDQRSRAPLLLSRIRCRS